MDGGLFVANRTRYSAEFTNIVETLAPVVFVVFFTLLGAEMQLSVLKPTWFVIVGLVALRIIGMWGGAFLGATIAQVLPEQRPRLGMAFIAQAGISLGLAREISVTFPDWGLQVSTVIVAVIVVNTLIGPPFLRMSITRAGEAHPRALRTEDEHPREVFIFGVERQSIALAKRLQDHDWPVVLVDMEAHRVEQFATEGLEIRTMDQVTLENLQHVGADYAGCIVAMLDADTNYAICETAFEHFGTDKLVVHSHEIKNVSRFQELGAKVVQPAAALVNLLDHYVRSPAATALLLGQEEDKDVIGVVVRNRNLHGIALRDITLPGDTLVLAVKRQEHLLLSHGYTRLRLGDEVTFVGAPENLEEVRLRFEAE